MLSEHRGIPILLLHIYWSFGGDLDDVYFGYSGVPINNVTFFAPSITGYCSALYFSASRDQPVLIDSCTNPNISWISFTFQFWIYPFSFATTWNDRGIICQWQNTTSNRYLHGIIRGEDVGISFHNTSCTGNTSIDTSNWYHLAHIYDYSFILQKVYVSGLVYWIHLASGLLQVIRSALLTIGLTVGLAPYFFDGLMGSHYKRDPRHLLFFRRPVSARLGTESNQWNGIELDLRQ